MKFAGHKGESNSVLSCRDCLTSFGTKFTIKSAAFSTPSLLRFFRNQSGNNSRPDYALALQPPANRFYVYTVFITKSGEHGLLLRANLKAIHVQHK